MSVAVIGYSCILPGGENVSESWDMINDGLNNIKDLPHDRTDITTYWDPNPTTPDKIYCKKGATIGNFKINPKDFGLNMKQMEDCDVNQLLSLVKVKEAVEMTNYKGDYQAKKKLNMGCVLGIGGGQKISYEFRSRMEYALIEKILRKAGMPEDEIEKVSEKYKANFPEWRLDSFPGMLGNVTSGRIANQFNLNGMNCVVDSACASSLTALRVAMDEIQSGGVETMITGACCSDTSLHMYMAFSKTPVFSKKDGLTAYSKEAAGMLIGEGSVMLVIKKLEAARRDGDKIHAVIHSCGASSDGASSGIYTPVVSGQEMAVRRAWSRANVDPGTVTLLEGHGTGTTKGDQLELTGLKNVFSSPEDGNTVAQNQQIAVGSIKSQVGHLKAAAGFAGIMKVILALKHKVLPRSINVTAPPPSLDITNSPLYVNKEPRPWFAKCNNKGEVAHPRRAGVSAFGFGGTNWHAVIEEAEEEHVSDAADAYRMNTVPQACLLSAPTKQMLIQQIEAALQKIGGADADADPTNDQVIATREFFESNALGNNSNKAAIPANHPRLGFVVANISELKKTLNMFLKKEKSTDDNARKPGSLDMLDNAYVYRPRAVVPTGSGNKVAAVFTGQGNHEKNMFSELARNWPEFRHSMTGTEKACRSVIGHSVTDTCYPRALYEDEDKAQHDSWLVQDGNITTNLSSVATAGCSIALYDLLKANTNFSPDMCCGHSLGEFCALYAAGSMTKEEFNKVVSIRCKSISEGISGGSDNLGMVAILSDDGFEKLKLPANVWVANFNSPSQCVLTGETKNIKKVQDVGLQNGKCIALQVDAPFHSPLMDKGNKLFSSRLQSSTFRDLQIPVFCNGTGEMYTTDVKSKVLNHMTAPVKFVDMIRNAYFKNDARVFVEFGPKSVCNKLVKKILTNGFSGPGGKVVAPDSVEIVSLGADMQNTEASLRKAVVKLAALGVLDFSSRTAAFDPWALPSAMQTSKKLYGPNAGAIAGAKKNVFEIEMSAPTFIGKKRKADLAKLMDDGFRLRSAGGGADTSAITAELAKLKQHMDAKALEVAELKQQLTKAKTNAGMQTLPQANTQHLEAEVAQLRASQQQVLQQKELQRLELESAHEKINEMQELIILQSEKQAMMDRIQQIESRASLLFNKSVGGSMAGSVVNDFQNMRNGFHTAAKAEEVRLAALQSMQNASANRMKQPVGSPTLLTSNVNYAAPSPLVQQGSIVNQDSSFNFNAAARVQAKQAPAAAPVEVVKMAPVVAAPAPVLAQAPAASDPAVNAKAMKVVYDVMADKTGYDTDMISEEMNLETDLGIDSIKRVEILGAVQDELNIKVTDLDALGRTKTVGDVVAFMQTQVGGAPVAAAATVAAVQPISAAPAAAAANSALSANAMKVVYDVMADKTGYDTDMISEEMNLETDLGIDSIKRVEILGAVQDELNIKVTDLDALGRTKTVGDVVAFMQTQVGGSSAAPVAVAAPVASVLPIVAAAPAGPAVSNDAVSANAMKVVYEVMADKTGYDTDMISEEMNLETDLGIDSIKRVEILGAVQDELNIKVTDLDALGRTKTVGDVVAFMQTQVGAPAAPVAAAAPAQPAVVAAPAASNDAVSANAMKVVYEVMADKTGYDTDMISEEMNLETDLGIDSIKRVEILGAVQDELSIKVTDLDALGRTKTVGDVVAFMQTQVGAAPAASVAAAVPVQPVVAAAPAAPAVSNDAVSANAMKVVYEVMADKTGYDTDMISEEMNLETDLGIDSIKRVEILGAVQDELSIKVTDLDALGRTKTVGDVVAFMQTQVGGAPAAPVAAAAPVVPAQPVVVAAPATPAASNDAVSANAMKVVYEVMADKTGYDTDMISEEMNLETDLGIDSIKRVEILGAVQDELSIKVTDLDALGRTKTVGDVVAFMQTQVGAAPAASVAASVPVQPVVAAAPAAPAVSNDAVSANAMKVVYEVMADKTGYDTDMISEEMNLETDLGIDSIKRVEILGAVQDELSIKVTDLDALGRTKTVGDVVAFMQTQVGGAPAAAAPAASVPTAAIQPVGQSSVQQAPASDTNHSLIAPVTVSVPKVVDICFPTEAKGVSYNSNDHFIVIHSAGSLNKATSLKAALLSNKAFAGVSAANVKVAAADSFTAEITGNIAGAICIHDNGAPVNHIFNIATHFTKAMQGSTASRPFFVAVTEIDGNFGYAPCSTTTPATSAPQFSEAGAIFGLMKTLQMEWTNVMVKAVDFDTKSYHNNRIIAEILDSGIGRTEVSYKTVDNGETRRRGIVTSDLTKINDVAETARKTAITSDDVFLVTGGARGITPHCLREMATKVRGVGYILLGRSELMDVPQWARGLNGRDLDKAVMKHLKEQGGKVTPAMCRSLSSKLAGTVDVLESLEFLKGAGARVTYKSCDISAPSATIQAVLNECTKALGGRPITGLIHASGVIRDKKMENKTADDFAAVYGTKFDGLMNILSVLNGGHKGLQGLNLRHILLFSSMAGFCGNFGQSDYAMANEALNKVSQALTASNPNLHVASYGFGPWDSGMVTPLLKQQFMSQGVEVIPLKEGAELVAELFCNHQQHQQVLFGNWMAPPKKAWKNVNDQGANAGTNAATAGGSDSSQASSGKFSQKISLADNCFLRGHQIQKPRTTLPVSAAVAAAKAAVEGHVDLKFLGCDSMKLFNGVQFEESLNGNAAELEIEVKQTAPTSCTVMFTELPQGRPCYKATCDCAPTQHAEKDVAQTKNAEFKQIETTMMQLVQQQGWNKANAPKKSSAEVYQQIFHTEDFRIIDSVETFDNSGLLVNCHSSSAAYGSSLSAKDSIDLDIAGQCMVLWCKLTKNRSSLPTEYSNVRLFKETADWPSSYKAGMTVLKQSGNITTGRIVAFGEEAGAVVPLLAMDVTGVANERNIY